MPTSCAGRPLHHSAGSPVDGSWSVSRNTYPAAWVTGVASLNASSMDTTVRPSEPAETVTMSMAPSASPTGSLMIGMTGTPPVAPTLGTPSGTSWRNQPGSRWTVTSAGGRSGNETPRSRSFASYVVGAVPAFARSIVAVVVWPYSTVTATASGSTAAMPPMSAASSVSSPPSVMETGAVTATYGGEATVTW